MWWRSTRAYGTARGPEGGGVARCAQDPFDPTLNPGRGKRTSLWIDFNTCPYHSIRNVPTGRHSFCHAALRMSANSDCNKNIYKKKRASGGSGSESVREESRERVPECWSCRMRKCLRGPLFYKLSTGVPIWRTYRIRSTGRHHKGMSGEKKTRRHEAMRP